MKLSEFITNFAHYEWMELVLETAKPSQTDKYLPVSNYSAYLAITMQAIDLSGRVNTSM